MPQLRFDGKTDPNDEPEKTALRRILLKLGDNPDLDIAVNEAYREGVWKLEDVPGHAREAERTRFRKVALKMHEKGGAPTFLAQKKNTETDTDHLLIHIDAATTEERGQNVKRRRRQLFGAYFRAHASRDDMLGRNEKAPRLPVFKNGWRVLYKEAELEPGNEFGPEDADDDI